TLADFGVEPTARVLAARFAGERKSPFAEAPLEIGLVEKSEIADAADADGVEMLLHHFADAGNTAHFAGRQEAGFEAGVDPEDSVAFRLIGGDFRDQP